MNRLNDPQDYSHSKMDYMQDATSHVTLHGLIQNWMLHTRLWTTFSLTRADIAASGVPACFGDTSKANQASTSALSVPCQTLISRSNLEWEQARRTHKQAPRSQVTTHACRQRTRLKTIGRKMHPSEAINSLNEPEASDLIRIAHAHNSDHGHDRNCIELSRFTWHQEMKHT